MFFPCYSSLLRKLNLSFYHNYFLTDFLLTCFNIILVSAQFWLKLWTFKLGYFSRKIYIARKIALAPAFLAWSNTCSHAVYHTRRVLKIDFRSAFYEISCTTFGHLVFYTCQAKISWKSCSLIFLASLSDQFCENKFLYSLLWAKLCISIANACLPQGQDCNIWGCIMNVLLKVKCFFFFQIFVARLVQDGQTFVKYNNKSMSWSMEHLKTNVTKTGICPKLVGQE